MSESSGDTERPVRPAPSRPPPSTAVPSPLEGLAQPAPPAVLRSFAAWITASLVGLAAAGYAVATLDSRREELRTQLQQSDPGLTEASRESVVTATLLIAVVLFVAPAVLELLLAVLVRRRHGWARVVLVPVALLGLAAVAVGTAVLREDVPAQEDYVLLAAVLHAVLVVAALVLMLTAPANAWFRSRPRTRSRSRRR